MTQNITVLILTWNEEANIGRTLSCLRDFERIIVLDSCSNDRTPEIVRSFPNTCLISRPFDDHTSQWNYGLQSCGIQTEWVLSLDADYQLSDTLVKEIFAKTQTGEADGFWMSFIYAIEGVPIRSGVYPPVIALFKRELAVYVNDGHTQRLSLHGKTGKLNAKAIHDDRKTFERWVNNQLRYARIEAEYLLQNRRRGLADSIRRKVPFAPLLMFFYCLLWRGGLLDGAAGWMYAWQRLIAEVLIQYFLLMKRISK
jgi:glycosyltransferase involved in cell wall biosynthesis